MVKTNELIFVWKSIFKNWKYSLITIITAIIFYEINILITNYQTLLSLSTSFSNYIYLLSIISLGFYNTVELHSFISLIIISILLGTLASLLTYKTRIIKIGTNKKTNAVTTFGIFLGILAPGCAACGIGLISALGLSTAFITFLPYDGLEISIFSIALLLYANFSLSKSLLNCKTCKIELKHANKKLERGYTNDRTKKQ